MFMKVFFPSLLRTVHSLYNAVVGGRGQDQVIFVVLDVFLLAETE